MSDDDNHATDYKYRLEIRIPGSLPHPLRALRVFVVKINLTTRARSTQSQKSRRSNPPLPATGFRTPGFSETAKRMLPQILY